MIRPLQYSPRHSSPSRPRLVLPYAILRRVSSSSTSRAAPPQPWLRCAPERAAAPCEVRVHTPGEARPLAGGAEVLQGARSRGASTKSASEFLSALKRL